MGGGVGAGWWVISLTRANHTLPLRRQVSGAHLHLHAASQAASSDEVIPAVVS